MYCREFKDKNAESRINTRFLLKSSSFFFFLPVFLFLVIFIKKINQKKNKIASV